MRQAAEVAMHSGGSIKIDFKAYDNELVQALCGSSNRLTIYNVKMLGAMSMDRPETPLMVVSSLLIPGYIESDQIEKSQNYWLKLIQLYLIPCWHFILLLS